MTRQRRTFIPEFKLQMVKLHESGKSRAAIAREYDLTLSPFQKSSKLFRNVRLFSKIGFV